MVLRDTLCWANRNKKILLEFRTLLRYGENSWISQWVDQKASVIVDTSHMGIKYIIQIKFMSLSNIHFPPGYRHIFCIWKISSDITFYGGKKPIMISRLRIVCRILAPSRQRKYMEWFCSMVRRVYIRYLSALISAITMYFQLTFAKNEIHSNDCF